ncbi:hypothetical protein BKA62DRAFT_346280 [Auriculariales sp. MPI-PUGE-AT-0066]|nr:hypothetical protein BKA62DRAFT_346280 [Auriculariales sp. MPI-PUGE-AT-0066]
MSIHVKRGPCAICSSFTTNWCSRCQNVFYCSPQHLQSDWPRHRMFCAAAVTTPNPTTAPMTPLYHSDSSPDGSPPAEAYQSMRSTPSPIPMTVTPVGCYTGLYFSKNEEHPRIVTVNCQPPATPGSAPRPILSNYLPSSGGIPPSSIVLKQGLGCQLRYPLHVWYCPGSNTTNKSIWRLTGGQAQRPWKGDVLVLKYSGGRRSNYMDATSLDMPAVAQFFMSHR